MKMNVFKDFSGFCGEVDVERLHADLREFFAVSTEIRGNLGKKAYLLDEYVLNVLRGINANDAFRTMDSVYDVTCEWHQLILLSDEVGGHPLFETFKQYLTEQNQGCQEKPTRDGLCVIALASDFFCYAIEKYEKDCCDKIRADVDICNVRQFYTDICKMLGGDGLMERLNFAIRQRFVVVSSMAIFAQGLTANLLCSLTDRDIETGRTMLSLSLKNKTS
jgi:hypothetical protein